MSVFKCSNPKYFQLSVFLAATLFYQGVSATQVGSQWSEEMAAGSTVIISLDPPLPRRGESFTIEVSGTWRNPCVARLANLNVDLDGLESAFYLPIGIEQLIRVWTYPPYCPGDEYEPTPFTRSAVIPSSAWEHIDEKKPLSVELSISAIAVPHSWYREFDLSWGLHEIPPQLGHGYWISDQRPFQGLNIEQQSDTVVLFKLGYHTGDGEPSWRMANARFHGDVTHGVAYHVRWLNPSNEFYGLKSVRDYVQPKEDEMSFTHRTFGIDVEGVNRIKVFFGRTYINKTYKRYVFRLADNQLPVVIPDMVGKWNLYAFDNQNLEESFLVEFRAATKIENGLYRFKSIDDQWVLDCRANFDGVGDCDLANEDLGKTMSYDLLDFNGNYATAPLVTLNTVETTRSGILLRAGFRLPVLDFQ